MQSMDRKPFVTSYFPANIWYLTLLVTTLLLTGGGKVQAQGTDSVVRRSNFAARWAVADSLRRRMRQAADEGRLLQWGDSVVRAKWGRGLTDSAQTLRKRLTVVLVMATSCCKKAISGRATTRSMWCVPRDGGP